MSDLLVVAFDDDTTAFEMRAALARLQREYLIEMEDVVVVTRDDDGKVRLHQAVNLAAAGAVGGSLWGMLIGLIFLNPLLGAAVGAGAGAISGAVTDTGIDDGFMKEIGEKLRPGGSALCVLARRLSGDKLLARLEEFRARGHVLQTSLSDEDETRLRALIERQSVAVPEA
ncbi:DUF1269 domain-containing protein [Frigidibacter oleivorans]|uniref:DUF1269 domain-containing protein n=1 Tax=Frigidibacter oleivorans TaxID=2487129 RepID=UPI000F8F5141|nr:DUF1269 domain-containing protein [Frigidibacter oleivorans]